MSTTDLSLSPVVAIDIDGVFRIRHDPLFDVPGAFSHEVTYRQGDYPTIFHGQPYFEDWFSGVGAAWARTLIDRGVEVVLATTWQHWANTYFGEILGLPELPVAVKEIGDDQWHHCSPGWKSRQLARQFNGRPLMWVDDNKWDRQDESLVQNRLPKDRALTHFQQPFPGTGIEASDVTEMDAWLELASTTEGQAELRAQRRRKKNRDVAADRRWRIAADARRHQVLEFRAAAAIAGLDSR
jgi:hypothetical protein